MEKITRSTTIHRRVEDVFDFLEDKTHFPEFWPSMMEVSDIRDLPNGGKQFHWAYKMAGLRIEGDTEGFQNRSAGYGGNQQNDAYVCNHL